MRQAVDDTTRLVWICNPNNPTGTYESVEDIRNFISTLPKDVSHHRRSLYRFRNLRRGTNGTSFA